MRMIRPTTPSSLFSCTRSSALGAFLALIASVAWVRTGKATTAVALYVKDFAVVAADGRVNKIGPMISGHQSGCKLYVAGSKVAVVAGLAEEPDSGFDVRKILHQVMNQAATPSEAADAVEQQIQQTLPAALQVFQKNNPTAYRRRASGSSQLLMVGMSNAGDLQVSRRSIPYAQARAPQRDDATGVADHVGVALIGETAAVDADLIRLHNTNGWEGMNNVDDLEKLARRFIALEVLAEPDKVGAPLSLVLVDKNGIHWIEPGACKE
jgi:hypothetical protein